MYANFILKKTYKNVLLSSCVQICQAACYQKKHTQSSVPLTNEENEKIDSKTEKLQLCIKSY